jgi:hypothetical protein
MGKELVGSLTDWKEGWFVCETGAELLVYLYLSLSFLLFMIWIYIFVFPMGHVRQTWESWLFCIVMSFRLPGPNPHFHDDFYFLAIMLWSTPNFQQRKKQNILHAEVTFLLPIFELIILIIIFSHIS